MGLRGQRAISFSLGFARVTDQSVHAYVRAFNGLGDLAAKLLEEFCGQRIFTKHVILDVDSERNIPRDIVEILKAIRIYVPHDDISLLGIVASLPFKNSIAHVRCDDISRFAPTLVVDDHAFFG